jgi:hypothetical protein
VSRQLEVRLRWPSLCRLVDNFTIPAEQPALGRQAAGRGNHGIQFLLVFQLHGPNIEEQFFG